MSAEDVKQKGPAAAGPPSTQHKTPVTMLSGFLGAGECPWWH